MSGHSKWHSIKHKKAAADAKRGKIFTRLIKEISMAARLGGGDVDGNARLRKAVSDAKAANMPADNIKRAIMKGTGELPGAMYEEITYEGYGPGGVAVLVQTMTDNKNRTVSELRHIFTKNNGNLGESGCVSWMFDRKGYFLITEGGKTEDELMEIGLDSGADDVKAEDDSFEITCSPDAFETVKEALDKAGVPIAESEIAMIPQTTVKVTGNEARLMLRLMETLEDHDDAQNVYANFDIDESEMQD
ncbi:MAG: YebC/PmpR family DNA-binding transcriptional regulator [Acidobacteria bacterium]|nr:YebC/PmpR family DNA-binding transcriptional regulator [Acidobacteriota bacterium]